MKTRIQNWLMVLSAALLASITSVTAGACTDYSGNYQSALDDGTLLNLKLKQKGCESMVMDYKYSDGTTFLKTMIFDGAYRVIFDEPTFKTIEAFSITSDEIHFAAKLENKSTGSKNTLKGTFTQNGDGSLTESKTFFALSGKPLLRVIIVHSRIAE